ncbi:hypothetical protein [Bradyrhizobium sp. CCBAU 11357]|uniref:hypothetical protein n=1 Tax=Bradyrhizobium sp. CCBAU 11357 TaxID=1630808 RepID=UPI002304D08B|nr:hypothetical protein [Bradyrhizobium sp. CCBAU 11357]
MAGLVIEHLGAREYRDDPLKNTCGPTGNPEPERLYASNPELTALIESEWRTTGQAPRVSAPNALIQLGEGQPVYLKGIPKIALVTVPQYLLSIEPGDASLFWTDKSAASRDCCDELTPCPATKSEPSRRLLHSRRRLLRCARLVF